MEIFASGCISRDARDVQSPLSECAGTELIRFTGSHRKRISRQESNPWPYFRVSWVEISQSFLGVSSQCFIFAFHWPCGAEIRTQYDWMGSVNSFVFWTSPSPTKWQNVNQIKGDHLRSQSQIKTFLTKKSKFQTFFSEHIFPIRGKNRNLNKFVIIRSECKFSFQLSRCIAFN